MISAKCDSWKLVSSHHQTSVSLLLKIKQLASIELGFSIKCPHSEGLNCRWGWPHSILGPQPSLSHVICLSCLSVRMEESGRGSVKIDKTHPGTLGRGRVLVTCRCRGRWKLTPQGAGYPGAGRLPASSPAFPLRFVSVLPPVCPCPKQGLAGAG